MTDPVAATALVIVAFNDATTVGACVQSVRAAGYTDPIVVVDNASDDNTLDVVRDIADGDDATTAIRTDTNRGYAGGFNVGRHAVDADIYAVMNADCVVEQDWIGVCAEFLATHDHVAAACPTVALADGSGLNAEGLLLHKAGFGFNRHLGRPMADAATEASEVGGVQGTAFAIRRSVLDRIGGWSEHGFLYHEDVELSWAIASLGMEVWHVPTHPILHDYHLTMSPEKFYLLERNRVEMLLIYLGFLHKLLLAPVLAATEAAVWVYAFRKRSGLAAAKWASYRAVSERRALRRRRARQVDAFRVVGDRALTHRMGLRYPRSQTRTLMSEPPSAGRRGDRSMPTN